MKKYLLNTLLFTILCLIFAFALDTILSFRLRQNQNRMFANWNQIYNDTTNYDLVINGNSRAWLQYNPFIIDSILHINSYNLGIDGSPINRQIIKYQKYCDLHKMPKYLIQNIDLVTMGFRYGYERVQFFPYFFFDQELIIEIDEYENFSLMEKYVPCYRYLGYTDVITKALFNKLPYFGSIEKGYEGQVANWDGTELAKTTTIECACDTDAVRIFIDFLSEVTLNGTKVIFVYAPIYHEVREKMVNEKKMYEMYDTIAQCFNIPILDYNDISMCYDTTYFYNGTHLNKLGAEVFTTKLAHDIDSLRLLK